MTEPSNIRTLRFMATFCVAVAFLGVIYCLWTFTIGYNRSVGWGGVPEDPTTTTLNQLKIWLELVITPMLTAIAFSLLDMGNQLKKDGQS